MNGAPLASSERSIDGGSAPTALVWASAIAAACFVVTGLAEGLIIRIVRPTRLELDWTSDAMLSVALGVAMYLWLHLRATRLALTERERAQLVLQTQLTLAESMQRRLLPPPPEPFRGVYWAALLTPAGRIGGDFFDFLETASGVRLMLIADVSGKGIPAAMALTLLRATFRTVARATDQPAEIAARMSAAFHDEWLGSPYVTGLIVRVDAVERRLTYTNAGHPRGILLRDRTEHALSHGGPPLGLLKDATFEEDAFDLATGDVCVFVTDGVSEALDELDQTWDTAIVDAISRSRGRGADGVCRTIMALAQHGNGPMGIEDWNDDRTVVVLSVSADQEAG